MAATEYFEYYRNCLKMNETEYSKFVECTKSPLPGSFRVTKTSERDAIIERISKYTFLRKIDYLSDVFTFDPKERTPEMKEFIKFLVAQTSIGNIQRQEIVSMIPHKFLRLETHHNVLETCAAPGSKTKEILEVVKEGLIVSNEKSVSRSNILVTESIKKAYNNFLVTRADAVMFPNTSILFDRICCDVPCTADGTVRKSPSVLDNWTVQHAKGLSVLQYNILIRALDLLADNGVLVYSTCSLNPIENENVINKALSTGKYELIDNSELVQLSPDDSRKIFVREGITKFSFEDISFDNSELSKCIRILPHDQNTGGFFVAALRRIGLSKYKYPENIFAMPRTFCQVPEEIVRGIYEKYGTISEKEHFVSITQNHNNLFSLSDKAYNFLCSNPKLKFVYAGIKSYTKSDLKGGEYRPKGGYLTSRLIKPLIIGTKEDFMLLIKERQVSSEIISFNARGHFIVGFEGIVQRFCGFGSEKNIFIYSDDNQRLALCSIYCQ